MFRRVHNIEYSAKLLFAECLRKSTRQTDNTRRKKPLPSASHVALGKATLCRVPKSRHSANAPLPSAAWAALGNKYHVRHTSPHTPVTKVCRVLEKRHPAKPASPVEERPCALRQVLHSAKKLPSVFRLLPSVCDASPVV
jgi:hypothetical protein